MSPGGPARHVLLLLALLLALSVATAAPAGGIHEPAFGAATQIEADTVHLDLSIHEDGDADWAIRYRVRLDDDNATAAFESVEADVRENRSAFTERFETRIGGTVSAAENATGREMSVRNVSVRTERQQIPQQYGLLVYTFEWTGFAATDGDRIEAGDAIGGLYLDEATSLTIGWPSGYAVESVDPSPDETGDRSATWRGPAEFTTDQPRLVVAPAPSPGDGGADGDGEDGSGGGVDGGGDGTDSAGLPTTALLVGVLALAGLAAAVWWWQRSDADAPVGTDGTDEPVADTPEELLSNEERVLRLLREHGGRMKQQQVVEELGWTDAKTSQVVGELRESGEIEGFRLGRENVLDLPGDDTAADE